MIKQLHDSKFVRGKLEFLAGVARDIRSWLTWADAEGLDEEPEGDLTQGDVDEMVAGLEKLERDQVGAGGESFWNPPTDIWMPHDSDAAILQSVLDAYYRRNNCVAEDGSVFGETLVTDPLESTNLGRWPTDEDKARGHFTLNWKDPRWCHYLQAKAIKLRRKPVPFPAKNNTPIPVADNARMVLFGDWASGIPKARQLATEMWQSYLQPEKTNRQLHAIHLGDTYYAGLNRDYQKRCTPHWPVPSNYAQRVASWCIPGNHDMYSGGHGFFHWIATDLRFARQQGASYFLLENEHWQVFGLDSAYGSPDHKGDIGTIYGPQIAWMAQERLRAPQKQCVLLTHHQPFSAFAKKVDAALQNQLGPIAAKKQITTWFWGHEHYCAVYGWNDDIPFPILLGHGGFPERRVSVKRDRPSLEFDWHFADGGGFVVFGFAVLDFDSSRIEVGLIDLNGTPRNSFTIGALAGA